MHYYQHNIGDYRRDTMHLTLLEHGAYRQLLDLYYLNECELDANAMRLVCARTKDEIKAVENVLNEFFEKTENGYSHKRCDEEIAVFHSKSDKARASAGVRWSKKNANAMRTHSEGNAKAMLTINHKPLTNNQDIKAMSGKPDAMEVLNFLNQKANRNYRETEVNLKLITARLKEGYTVQDCKSVIAKKCREWLMDDKMAEYLRPATLFNREKFNQYAGELVETNDE